MITARSLARRISMPGSRCALLRGCLLVLACLLTLSSGHAQAEDRGNALYVSPGVVYSGFDQKNGGHAIGGELSVPFVVSETLGIGPYSQVQWTQHKPHYIAGMELVFMMFALELGWYTHGGVQDGSQGFSAALLFGVGLGWIGTRMSVDSHGTISWALNISLKAPVVVGGCHYLAGLLPHSPCRVFEQPRNNAR